MTDCRNDAEEREFLMERWKTFSGENPADSG